MDDYSNIVNQAYQTILGRAPEQAGADYWTGQLASDALTPQNIYQNIAYAAQGADTANAQTYLQNLQNYQAGNTGGISTLPSASPAPPVDYGNLVTQAYGNIGRTTAGTGVSGLTPEEVNYWTGQMQSGAMTPEQFQQAFTGAVTGYIQQNPNDPYTQYVSDYLANKNVNQLYQDVLHRAPEQEGLDYWKKTFGYDISPEELATFKYAAAPELVTNAYQQVLSRAADQGGSDYWIQQLRSGAITPENLAKSIAYGSQGIEDRLAAQRYLGEDYFAPASYLQGTSGLGYKDVVNYVNANLQDPTNVYMASQRYGVDPNEILQAYQSQGASPYTLQQIQDYLNTGKAGYETKFNDIVGSVFGSGQNLTDVKNLLYANYTNQVNKLNLPENIKQQLLEKETPDTLFETRFGSSGYSTKSFDDIKNDLQNSSLNKLQDAYTLSGVAQNVLGYSADDAKALIGKAMTGNLSEVEKKIYDSLLKNNAITGDDQTALLSYAAANTPNAPIFQKNPDLLILYTPINPQTGTTGQYGYYHNAPILNAKFIDQELGDKNSKGMDVGAGSDLGWATSSKYQGRVSQGPGLFGIDIPQYQIDAIKKVDDLIKEQGGLQTRQYTDPETNQTYNEQVLMAEYVDPETGQKGKYLTNLNLVASQFGWGGGGDEVTKSYLEIKNDITNAAKKVGIDPSQYSTLTDLYNALDDKTKNLYQVTGRTGTWDPAAAASVGTNHASVLYQRIGDKLVPISDPQGFNFDDPKKKSWLQETLSGFAPLIQMGLLASGFGGGLAALMEGTFGTWVAEGAGQRLIDGLTSQLIVDYGVSEAIAPALASSLVSGGTSGITSLLMSGGDFDKALSSAGLSALGGGIGSLVSSNLAGMDIPMVGELTDKQSKFLGNLLGGAAVTGASGKDLGNYFANKAISMGIGALAASGSSATGISVSDQDKAIFTAMMPIIRTGKANPDDIVKLSQALKNSGYLTQMT